MVHHGQVFDGLAGRGEPLNSVTPDRVPNGSTGTIPVIARLVWEDCEEWWPARAVRWTDTAVLVSIQLDPPDPLKNKTVWLAVDDVKRRHRQPHWSAADTRRHGRPRPGTGSVDVSRRAGR